MNLYSLSKAAAEHTRRGRRGLPAQSDERRHTPVTGVQVPGMIFQIMRKAQANELILKDPVKLADKTRHAPRKSNSIPLKRLQPRLSLPQFRCNTVVAIELQQHESLRAFYLLTQQKSPEILRFQDFLWSECNYRTWKNPVISMVCK